MTPRMTHQPILDWCNEQREKLGLRPAKKLARGRPEHSSRCPLANTIRGRSKHSIQVGYLGHVFADDVLLGRAPRGVVEFLRAFEGGSYPELERRP